MHGLKQLRNLGDKGLASNDADALRAANVRGLGQMDELDWCFCHKISPSNADYQHLGNIHREADKIYRAYNSWTLQHGIISFYIRPHAEGSWFVYDEFMEFIEYFCEKFTYGETYFIPA